MHKSRITMILTVAHQMPKEQPLHIDVRYAVGSSSEETPYKRTVEYPDGDSLLDTGWIEGRCTIALQNIGDTEALVMDATLLPGEAMLFTMEDSRNAMVRGPCRLATFAVKR